MESICLACARMMSFSGDATKHSVKVQKIRRRDSSTTERSRRAGNVIYGNIRPANSQTSADKELDNHHANSSSVSYFCFLFRTDLFPFIRARITGKCNE